MKPYNERLPLIDAAIDHCKGVLPKNFCNQNGSFYSDEGHIKQLVDRDYLTVRKICTHDEFNQRAKELGYINGYKYGVEYETNGEKPDLPKDVEVEVYSAPLREWCKADRVGSWHWFAYSKFRIVDERYKPKEQDMNDDLPAIGSRVDIVEVDGLMYGHGETDCEVVGHFEDAAIVRMSYGLGCFKAKCLKPSNTETDKLVEQMERSFESTGCVFTSDHRALAEHLIEQGYRKIKPMSEGEFVQSALKSFQTKRFEVSQLKLVCESLRKLHMADLRFIDNGADK